MQLRQKHKVFFLTESGIRETTIGKGQLSSEELYPYENIRGDKEFYVAKAPHYLIYGAVFLVIYALVLVDSLKNGNRLYLYNLVWALAGVGFIGLYFFHQPKLYFLKTFSGGFIRFSASKDPLAVRAFIEEGIKRRNVYLRIKYANPNPHMNYDTQFSNLNILQRENVITLEEYQEKIVLLNSLFNQTAPNKVFITYSQN